MKRFEFINNKYFIISIIWFSFALSATSQTLYLYTPNGSRVSAFYNSEMSASDIDFYTRQCANTYPQAEVLGNASSRYNCHSYAWNITEGGSNICWLNQNPDLHLYWDDGSYNSVNEANAAKVFYYSGDHSAVKSSTHTGKYESKWGSLPLMRHAPTYGPSLYNMQYRRYYRKGCVSDLINQTITGDISIVSCNNSLNIQNTTVKTGANVTIVAPQSVIIKPPFIVENGANVLISILDRSLQRSNQIMPYSSVKDENSIPVLTIKRDVELIFDKTELLQIYPNPFSENFSVHYELLFEATNAKIIISNMTGQTIIQMPITSKNSSISINGTILQSGVYMCSLIDNGKILSTVQIVKK